MEPQPNNFAFIDSQNLNLGVRRLGWRLDYQKFRTYLREKHCVVVAYMFLGFVVGNKPLYGTLRNAGFILVFKPTMIDANGRVKGNVDADLVLRAATELGSYDKAIIVSNDVYRHDKLEAVLSPERERCSYFLRNAARERIWFMNHLRTKLEYTKRKGTAQD